MSNDLEDGLNIRPDDIVWMKNGKVHREDGPAIEHQSGYSAWYFEGMKHRLDAPAIIWHDGSMEWFVHGSRHREDGPAVTDSDGSKEWWINDVQLTEEEFNQWLEKKELNEKLHTNLEEKSSHKINKI